MYLLVQILKKTHPLYRTVSVIHVHFIRHEWGRPVNANCQRANYSSRMRWFKKNYCTIFTWFNIIQVLWAWLSNKSPTWGRTNPFFFLSLKVKVETRKLFSHLKKTKKKTVWMKFFGNIKFIDGLKDESIFSNVRRMEMMT